MKKDYSKYLWGIMLILLGVFIVLKSFGVITQSFFFTGWWTFLIIIPAVYGLIFSNNKVTDAVVALSGVALFGAANDVFGYDNAWAIITCLILVGIGFSIMNNRKRHGEFKPSQGKRNYNGVFGGCSEKPIDFDGGSAIAVFGSVDIDLRDIVFTQDVYLSAFAVFGGIDIIVNDNINVVTSTSNIFGGTENKQEPISGNHTLYIDGLSLFGGIDIKKKA